MSPRNLYKRNKELIITVIIAIIILIALIIFKVLYCDEMFFQDNNLHYNILSVNAIIAGFLFTGLSIIVTVIDKERVRRLSDNGYLDVFYNTLFTGIAFHILSIIFSIINILDIFSSAIIIIGYFEVSFLILGLVVFIKSVLLLREIIKIVKGGK